MCLSLAVRNSFNTFCENCTDRVRVGCVPGPRGRIISVQDAIAKPWPKGPMSLSEVVKGSLTGAVASSASAPEAAAAA